MCQLSNTIGEREHGRAPVCWGGIFGCGGGDMLGYIGCCTGTGRFKKEMDQSGVLTEQYRRVRRPTLSFTLRHHGLALSPSRHMHRAQITRQITHHLFRAASSGSQNGRPARCLGPALTRASSSAAVRGLFSVSRKNVIVQKSCACKQFRA